MAGGTSIVRGIGQWLPHGAVRPFGRPLVFLFHGVEKRIDDIRIQFNHHTLDAFHRIMKAMKSEFQVLPLSALPDVLKRPEKHGRSAFLTCDDGYRNILTNAADVLDGLGLPWTLFVSTHHIDSGELQPLTAARLFCLYGPGGRHSFEAIGDVILSDEKSRLSAAKRCERRLRAMGPRLGEETSAEILSRMRPDQLKQLLRRFESERFLNWPQVADLSRRGVEIGAHAHRHWAMDKLRSSDELAAEAKIARQRIENQIGSCRYFAYPFGNISHISREAWHAVRDARFEFAFTTLAGTLDGGRNPWLLPRYTLRPEERHLSSLATLLRVANPRLAIWQRALS